MGRGEIINADSRQIYRHMEIGTGWPGPEALALVLHHGYGIINPDELYSAARFRADTRERIAAIAGRGGRPIVVGGTGFYVEALTGDMPLNRPAADDALRARLRDEARLHPPEVLHDWLASMNSAAATNIAPRDSYRIVRRLESLLAARNAQPPALASTQVPIDFAVVVLDVPRALLQARIRARVRQMFAAGLVKEADAVRTRFAGAPALSSLGYAEALAYHDGLASEADALALVERRTFQYAKRQQTWFRHMRDARRIAASETAAAVDTVSAIAREFFAAT